MSVLLQDTCQIKHIRLITVAVTIIRSCCHLFSNSCVQQYTIIFRHMISMKVLCIKLSGSGETTRHFLSFFSLSLLKTFGSAQGKETQCISCKLRTRPCSCCTSGSKSLLLTPEKAYGRQTYLLLGK